MSRGVERSGFERGNEFGRDDRLQGSPAEVRERRLGGRERGRGSLGRQPDVASPGQGRAHCARDTMSAAGRTCASRGMKR